MEQLYLAFLSAQREAQEPTLIGVHVQTGHWSSAGGGGPGVVGHSGHGSHFGGDVEVSLQQWKVLPQSARHLLGHLRAA